MFEEFMRNMYLLFEEQDFAFETHDQTLEKYSQPRVMEKRRKLAAAFLRSALGKRKKGKKGQR